jgi:hypothetical protein
MGTARGHRVLIGSVVGCAPPSVVVPSGGQQIHMIATASEVHLEPATVRPGDVYLVLDLPEQGVQLQFVFGGPGSGGSAPLTDAQLTELSRTGDAGARRTRRLLHRGQ